MPSLVIMKGYKLWKMDPGGFEFIISSEVTCDETHMRMKCKDLEVKEFKTIAERTQFEMEVSTSETRD